MLPPIELTARPWHLAAEDWQPANPYATVGPTAAETRKTQVELNLNELKPWPEIPQLQNASGLGTYTTSFDLPSDWSAANGAKLSLGEAIHSFQLTVNGHLVTLNQISAEGDAGPYLNPGRNVITVRVATTLNNRLAKLDEDVANRGLVQPRPHWTCIAHPIHSSDGVARK